MASQLQAAEVQGRGSWLITLCLPVAADLGGGMPSGIHSMHAAFPDTAHRRL